MFKRLACKVVTVRVRFNVRVNGKGGLVYGARACMYVCGGGSALGPFDTRNNHSPAC